MVATGATRAVLAISLAALGLNLAGNALLVGPLGIDGAAIATLATELTVAVGALFALLRSGVRGMAGEHSWRWLAGPLLGAASAWASAGLPLGAWFAAAGGFPS